MLNNFVPLFYFPTTYVCVDDDKRLLNSLQIVLEELGRAKLFSSAVECLAFLSNYQPVLAQYSFLKSVKEDEGYGGLEHTPLDFNVMSLVDIANNPDRFNEVSALIIDYSMPEMNGYELAEKSKSTLAKILLTGEAQEQKIIEGFNSNLINHFVQKASGETEDRLVGYLKDVSLKYFQRITFPLLSCLEAENKLPLSDPAFISFFNDFCENYQIREYYLIDKQGGFLCIDNEGNRLCLVIQTDESLNFWMSTYSIESTLSVGKIGDIKTRKLIPFAGIGVEGWHIDPLNWDKHLYPANTLLGREKYYWTIVNL